MSSPTPTIHAEAQRLIDKALDDWKHQNIVPSAHIIDLLLDLRTLLDG